MRIRDVIAVGGIVVAFMAVADWKYRHPEQLEWLRPDNNQHLGAEYDEIARAMRAGRGFSDPFREPSGPTAWMAPVLPYVLAGLYSVAGDDRQAVVEIVLSIKALILVVTGLLVVWVGRRIGRVVLAYLVLIGGLGTHFYQAFQRTHDEWLLLFVVNLIWLGIVWLWTVPKSIGAAVVWGLFGGVTALCGPITGATWAVVTAFRWIPRQRKSDSAAGGPGRSRFKPLAIAAICSIAVVSPWMLRNRVVLGKWIPIKSNLAYEVWQSLCLDDDGVVDARAGVCHPWRSAGEQRAEYVARGEVQYLASRWPLVWKTVREHPERFPEQCANRLLAATVAYQPSAWEDQQPRWLLWLKYAACGIPFCCLLIVIWLRRPPLEKTMVAAMWIYGAYLFPYILISYYDRYAMPLLGMTMLLVVSGLDTVLSTLAGRWRRYRAAKA